jgi:hypothetical protein
MQYIDKPLRILFTTEHKNAPSTVINAKNFARLNDIPGIRIDFFSTDYGQYDVVLFMGYDPQIKTARAVKKDLKIGVIDPRPGTLCEAEGADFIVANGIEMKEMFAKYFSNIYIYYIYPQLMQQTLQHSKHSKLIIGYHGNKVHLHTMHPHITTAIDALSEIIDVEFRAIYNIQSLGPVEFKLFNSPRVNPVFIQWSEDAYVNYLSDADIGIVPNLIPLKNDFKLTSMRSNDNKFYMEHDSDYLMRFKATSNAGRIMVFGQLGIPVIADMFPSALQVIRDGYNGMLACSTEGWYRALKMLSDSPELRSTLANNFLEDFNAFYGVEKLNIGFIEFLHKMKQSNYRDQKPELLISQATISNNDLNKGSNLTDCIKRGLDRCFFIFRKSLKYLRVVSE